MRKLETVSRGKRGGLVLRLFGWGTFGPSFLRPGEPLLNLPYERIEPFVGKVAWVDAEAGTIEHAFDLPSQDELLRRLATKRAEHPETAEFLDGFLQRFSAEPASR